MPRHFIARIYKVLERGNFEMALSLCESRSGPLTRLLKAGIVNSHLSKDDLQVVLEANVRLEDLHLSKHLQTLGFIGGIAVAIGLLGTVVGMFISFSAIWRASDLDTSARIAKGISSALLTTVGGLVVAIPAMVGYAYFKAKVNSMVDEMKRHSLSLIVFFTTGTSQLVKQESEQNDE